MRHFPEYSPAFQFMLNILDLPGTVPNVKPAAAEQTTKAPTHAISYQREMIECLIICLQIDFLVIDVNQMKLPA